MLETTSVSFSAYRTRTCMWTLASFAGGVRVVAGGGGSTARELVHVVQQCVQRRSLATQTRGKGRDRGPVAWVARAFGTPPSVVVWSDPIGKQLVPWPNCEPSEHTRAVSSNVIAAGDVSRTTGPRSTGPPAAGWTLGGPCPARRAGAGVPRQAGQEGEEGGGGRRGRVWNGVR